MEEYDDNTTAATVATDPDGEDAGFSEDGFVRFRRELTDAFAVGGKAPDTVMRHWVRLLSMEDDLTIARFTAEGKKIGKKDFDSVAFKKAVRDLKQEKHRSNYKDRRDRSRTVPWGVLPGWKREALVPPGWSLDDNGLSRISPEGLVPITRVPLLVDKIFRELGATRRERWQVLWFEQRELPRLRAIERGREVFASKHRIIELAAEGFPVTSTTASQIVDFLADFVAENAVDIPEVEGTSRCGWVGENRFVVGRESIQGTGSAAIELLVESPEEQRIAAAMTPRGDQEKWLVLASEITQRFAGAAVKLYGSFAAPMLRIFDCATFVIHDCGDSSRGKSTSLELAASVWGDPRPGHLVRTWEATLVSVERTAALLNDLPLALDEAQVARPESIGRLLYLLAGESGRGRGSKTGLALTLNWKTVVLSSGEIRLDSGTQLTGAQTRVLPVTAPFGHGDESQFAHRVREGVYENHGHAGPRFVAAILARRAEWEDWRKNFKEARDRWHAHLGKGLSARYATQLAVLEITGVLAHEILGLAGDPVANLREVAKHVEGNVPQSYAKRAFDVAYGFACSQATSFAGRERTDKAGNRVAPHGGYVGVWHDAEIIAFMPEPLAKHLADSGLDLGAAQDAWIDQGWLLPDKDHKRRKVSIPGSGNPRMVVLGISKNGEPRRVGPAEDETEGLSRRPGDDWEVNQELTEGWRKERLEREAEEARLAAAGMDAPEEKPA